MDVLDSNVFNRREVNRKNFWNGLLQKWTSKFGEPGEQAPQITGDCKDAAVVPPPRKEAPFNGGIIFGHDESNELKKSHKKISLETQPPSRKSKRIQESLSKENSIAHLKVKLPISSTEVPRTSVVGGDEDRESENSLRRRSRESRKCANLSDSPHLVFEDSHEITGDNETMDGTEETNKDTTVEIRTKEVVVKNGSKMASEESDGDLTSEESEPFLKENGLKTKNKKKVKSASNYSDKIASEKSFGDLTSEGSWPVLKERENVTKNKKEFKITSDNRATMNFKETAEESASKRKKDDDVTSESRGRKRTKRTKIRMTDVAQALQESEDFSTSEQSREDVEVDTEEYHQLSVADCRTNEDADSESDIEFLEEVPAKKKAVEYFMTKYGKMRRHFIPLEW